MSVDDARMLRRNGILLAIIAAGLMAVALLFGSGATRDPMIDRVLLGAALAMPVLLILGRAVGVADGLGRLMLAVLPVLLVVAPILAAGRAEAGLFAFLRFWPQILAGLAAGLALQALASARDTDSIGADFCLGAGLLALVLSLPSLVTLEMADSAVTVMLRSPVHLAITAVGFVILAILLRAFLTGWLSGRGRRFLTGLITLLPLLGFAGTILGIMAALRNLPGLFSEAGVVAPDRLDAVLSGLAGAFETTLLGLLAAIAATFAASLFDALHGGETG